MMDIKQQLQSNYNLMVQLSNQSAEYGHDEGAAAYSFAAQRIADIARNTGNAILTTKTKVDQKDIAEIRAEEDAMFGLAVPFGLGAPAVEYSFMD